MEKKFDVTLKSLLEDSPQDWPALAGVHEPKVAAIDADVSTISGAADKVLRLHGPPPSLMHFEFQARPDASLPRRTNVYAAWSCCCGRKRTFASSTAFITASFHKQPSRTASFAAR